MPLPESVAPLPISMPRKRLVAMRLLMGFQVAPPSGLVAIPPSVPVYITVGGTGAGGAGGVGRCVAGLKTNTWLSQWTFEAVIAAGWKVTPASTESHTCWKPA